MNPDLQSKFVALVNFSPRLVTSARVMALTTLFKTRRPALDAHAAECGSRLRSRHDASAWSGRSAHEPGAAHGRSGQADYIEFEIYHLPF
jgi:hypothetical protein